MSPTVRCVTTNGGRCRFNPNIYAEGKVCLSILGTWRGQRGEEWSSVQGLESVLLSIQSLMSSNPYENEPGYEKAKKDQRDPAAYIAKIRHETLRISVIQRLEGLLQIKPDRSEPSPKRVKTNSKSPLPVVPSQSPPPSDSSGPSTPASDGSIYEYDAEATFEANELEHWDPFADLTKRRFSWYYDAYVHSIETFSKEQSDGTAFKRMSFEYPPNGMEGKFDYKRLRTRVETIRTKLDEEIQVWKNVGARQVKEGGQLATQLAFQFKQLKNEWNEGKYSGSRLEISLPQLENPFVWHLTLFGEPMTNLDGGIFNMKLHIPPNFPTAQPRLRVETPIFHQRVSSTGILCYFPEKEDEISAHLKAIVAAVEDQSPNYDPRAMVNPESFALYWGGEDKRKIYNRKLRRSAQESSEFL